MQSMDKLSESRILLVVRWKEHRAQERNILKLGDLVREDALRSCVFGSTVIISELVPSRKTLNSSLCKDSGRK